MTVDWPGKRTAPSHRLAVWLCDNATEAGLESLPTQLLMSSQFRPAPAIPALGEGGSPRGLVAA